MYVHKITLNIIAIRTVFHGTFRLCI